ncbi:hypothetical protein [Sporolactobacillus sp. THM19-2]|uniref:hypothetical protein n=1 Tax=Sporolactobacillus sp. THM19-2 TaxID=2511171 RepID=UPI0010227B3A|nr:hypothetical protein [Sporolactobacillus sp. THM19-2]RYL89285.1 hypothetical protein EWH91_11040 [Sporolactobacillus sp. THM19-2]
MIQAPGSPGAFSLYIASGERVGCFSLYPQDFASSAQAIKGKGDGSGSAVDFLIGVFFFKKWFF